MPIKGKTNNNKNRQALCIKGALNKNMGEKKLSQIVSRQQ
jgi:hypothetical protein